MDNKDSTFIISPDTLDSNNFVEIKIEKKAFVREDLKGEAEKELLSVLDLGIERKKRDAMFAINEVKDYVRNKQYLEVDTPDTSGVRVGRDIKKKFKIRG